MYFKIEIKKPEKPNDKQVTYDNLTSKMKELGLPTTWNEYVKMYGVHFKYESEEAQLIRTIAGKNAPDEYIALMQYKLLMCCFMDVLTDNEQFKEYIKHTKGFWESSECTIGISGLNFTIRPVIPNYLSIFSFPCGAMARLFLSCEEFREIFKKAYKLIYLY